MKFRLRLFFLAALALLATACKAPPQIPPEGLAPLPPLPVEGARLYEIDPSASELRVLVYRAGTLSSLGHNHVVHSNALQGRIYVQEPLTRSGFEIVLPVQSLTVDEPVRRAQEGAEFRTRLTEQDIAATRANMLGEHVLNAARFPELRLRSARVAGEAPSLTLTVRASVRETQQDLLMPVTVSLDDTRLEAHGQTDLSQSALGITPFSVLMGALAVQDTLHVKYDIVARAGKK
jgi:polyisoprenoid-binding protein YceI